MTGPRVTTATYFDFKTTYDFSLSGTAAITFSVGVETFGPDTPDDFTYGPTGGITIAADTHTLDTLSDSSFAYSVLHE